MNIKTLVLGDLQNNCYVVTPDSPSGECVIIDTGLSSEPLLDYLQQSQLSPQALLLTHGHADHIAGLNLLRQTYPDIKVAISKADASMLADPEANLSYLVGISFTALPADIILDGPVSIEFAGICFKVLCTPGHTPGGVSFYCEKDNVVFSGDALFQGSIGRVDFPGGDFDTLISSIKSELFSLKPQTKVYSGHGSATSIEAEMKFNPYF